MDKLIFTGRPVEVIEYFVDNYDSMDYATKANFNNLITTIIKGSDVISLIDLGDSLKANVLRAKNRKSTIDLELSSREGKLNNDDEIDEIARARQTTRGEVLIRLNNECRERINERRKVEQTEDIMDSWYHMVVGATSAKIGVLSEVELEELGIRIKEVINEKQDRLETLMREMTSRKGKMQSDNELDEYAQRRGISRGKALTILNDEYRERFFEREQLVSLIDTYNSYSSVVQNNRIL